MCDGCMPGGVVYDPFAGSGSTLIAAEELGFIHRAIEIDPHYCDVIIQRWCDFTGKDEVILNGEKVSWNLVRGTNG